MAEHEQLSLLLKGLNPHDRALVERGWNTAIYYLEEKFTSTNSAMVPCNAWRSGADCQFSREWGFCSEERDGRCSIAQHQ